MDYLVPSKYLIKCNLFNVILTKLKDLIKITKASPPCPPSNRLLYLVKLGIQQELLNSTNSENEQSSENGFKKSSQPSLNNEIEIDSTGLYNF